VDGLLCTPGDVDDLVRALRDLYEPGLLASLRAAVRPADSDSVWQAYLRTLHALAGMPEQRPESTPALHWPAPSDQ
jgi:hypothetical protein